MIQVCWIQHGGEAPWAQQIANGLREHDIHVKFVTTMRATHEEYLKKGFESYFISQIFGGREDFSQAELAKLDREYGYPLIKNIVDSDVHLSLLFGRGENKKKQIIARAYKFWEQFFDEHSIDYLIVRETATFASRTAYNIARNRDRPLLMRPDIGPADSYFTMCDLGEELCWVELLQKIKGGYKPLTVDQRKQALALVEARTKVKPGSATIRKYVSLKSFPYRYLQSWLSEKSLSIASDPIVKAGKRLERQFMKRRALWTITRRLFPYDLPANEPHVFFPLYFEGESMTLANYRYWAQNMLPLVREVAASLPEGYCLYVKEHPAVPGEQSVFKLRTMQRIAGVKVIDPLVQGQSLIKGCSAVVVLQGTAGWEAFLNRKPVVVLSASVFYIHSRLVYKVKDICNLSGTLHEAIKEGESIYERLEDEWLWFIFCAVSSSSSGTWITFEPPYFRHANSENCKKLVDGFAEKMKRQLDVH